MPSLDASDRRKAAGVRHLVVVVLTVVAVLFALLPVADTAGHSHVDAAFKRALVGFALARGLNGVISVAQGTEVAFQPAGIGLNFTPGQILDPVNDLVERFSWIMMLASSSLGVQKVLLSMSAWNGLLVAVVVFALLFLACSLVRRLRGFRQVARRVFLFVLLLRFMMPLIAVTNDWVYRTFLEADYLSASASLEQAQQSIGNINDEVMVSQQAGPTSLLDKASELYEQTIAKMDFEQRLEEYRQAAESISESTIRLVVVFLMQTLVFPLVFLFVLMGLLRRMSRL